MNTSNDIEKEVGQELKKTELGTLILNNAKLIIAAIAVIFIAIIIVLFIRNNLATKHEEALAKIYFFNSKSITSYTTGLISDDDFYKKFEALVDEIGNDQAILPLASNVVSMLREKNKDLALKALEMVMPSAKKNKYSNELFSINLAALYEDNLRFADAIKTLESLISSKIKTLEPKIYTDLGRLNLLKGDKETAKLHFNYVITNYSDDEYAKISKIYLNEIK